MAPLILYLGMMNFISSCGLQLEMSKRREDEVQETYQGQKYIREYPGCEENVFCCSDDYHQNHC